MTAAAISPTVPDQAFTLFSGGARWAVPATCVQTVFRAGTITPVPLAPLVIAGLINLRGRVLVAIDLAARLGCTGGAKPVRDPRDLAVAIEHEGSLSALLVEGVGDVVPIGRGQQVSPPAHMPVGPARMTAFWFRDAGTIVPMLDVGRILGVEGDRRSGIERRAASGAETRGLS